MQHAAPFYHKITCLLFLLLGWFVMLPHTVVADLTPTSKLTPEALAPIEQIVEKSISDGKIPGAVVLIGNNGKVVYRRAFGNRSLDPYPVAMSEDTIFDLASLTKVVVTSTAILQLAERKKLALDDRVAMHWPSFKKNGKSGITIRQLLTHYSGLRAGLGVGSKWLGYAEVMQKIVDEKTVVPPGTSFIYSDINFQILGEIVRRISGLPLDRYCAKYIFQPLGMQDTRYSPPAKQKDRIAPTDYHRDGKLIHGVVHDPSCFAMGGICGNAGLFSTADDLSRFADMMLNQGKSAGLRILKPETIALMTAPQSPAGKKLHGLGWDMEEACADCPQQTLAPGSYGHLGYTGTALWIDPADKTYIILLTSRLHAKRGGDVKALRSAIKEIVACALVHPFGQEQRGVLPQVISSSARAETFAPAALQTGIDVLTDSGFAALAGLRVGLITNHTGRDARGRRTIDLLHEAPQVKLRAIFSPEHGLTGMLDTTVPASVDATTGLTVYSLYGKVKKPSEKMLAGLDALVFDIQDAGVRFYTYIATMGYAMEAAAKMGLAFYVLDRPNPITASIVQGPVSEEKKRSFTNYYPLPIRHGMTVGELAGMFNAEYQIGAKLTIIKMQGYQRTKWYDETGLPWINPSPNLRNLTEATLYPGVALVEGANVSVGRGTATPFEVFGAPWIDAGQLSAYLQGREIVGIKIEAADFTPVESTYQNQVCHGVRIALADRQAFDVALFGVEIVSALYNLYPHIFRIGDTEGLVGSPAVLHAIKNGDDPKNIARAWQQPLEEFCRLRARHLLYPSADMKNSRFYPKEEHYGSDISVPRQTMQ